MFLGWLKNTQNIGKNFVEVTQHLIHNIIFFDKSSGNFTFKTAPTAVFKRSKKFSFSEDKLMDGKCWFGTINNRIVVRSFMIR